MGRVRGTRDAPVAGVRLVPMELARLRLGHLMPSTKIFEWPLS